MTATPVERDSQVDLGQVLNFRPGSTPDPAQSGRILSGSMKIAIVVHGRFHAFDLARELLGRGHDVTLFTNYPRKVAKRFGIPGDRVHTFLAHGYLARILFRLAPGRTLGLVERIGNTVFGRWAADQVLQNDWDVVIAFSGIAEDLFLGLIGKPTLKVLQRGSSHIRTQRQILEEEQKRSGLWVEKPTNWIVAREEQEYRLADVIHVLSTFADRSFQEQGIPKEKLFHLLLGVSTNNFRATQDVIDARCERILRGGSIRVLNVGTFALRKGALDWIEILRQVGTKNHAFRFIGPVAADARRLRREAAQWATFIPKQPQHELPREYEWGDIFCLPTLEDGFAVVLTQALASGLPLLTTTNCAAHDLIREGEEGWVVPIRSPRAFIERLRWCHEHREGLVQMVRKVYASGFAWDWANTGKQAEQNIRTAFGQLYGNALAERRKEVTKDER